MHLSGKTSLRASEPPSGVPRALLPVAGHTPVVIWQLLNRCKERGLPLSPSFEGLPVDLDDLGRPGWLVPPHDGLVVVRRLLAHLGHSPGLGLECGRRFKLSKLGLVAMGLLASPTLADADALLLRHPWSLGFLVALHEGGDGGLCADALPGGADLMPFLVESLFASLVTVRRTVLNSDYLPRKVEFVHLPAEDTGRHYEAFFRCPVHWGALRNRLSTDAIWMNHPLPLAHPSTFQLAQELLDRMAREQQPLLPPLAQAVDQALRQGLPRPPAPAELAQSLHLSERSLRRKLAELGLSYEVLLDGARRARAEELIRHRHLPLARVADELGFADVRAFRRAFRRWTGRSPSQARGGDEALAVGVGDNRTFDA